MDHALRLVATKEELFQNFKS